MACLENPMLKIRCHEFLDQKIIKQIPCLSGAMAAWMAWALGRSRQKWPAALVPWIFPKKGGTKTMKSNIQHRFWNIGMVKIQHPNFQHPTSNFQGKTWMLDELDVGKLEVGKLDMVFWCYTKIRSTLYIHFFLMTPIPRKIPLSPGV